MNIWNRRVTGLVFATVLTACGQETSTTTAPVAVSPVDPKLSRLYDQTCKACHTSPGSGAPQAGDKKAWEPRIAQGMQVLLDHTINGYKGMPPLGSCMDCTETDFEALIRFMAGINA